MAFEPTCIDKRLLPAIELMKGTNKLVGGLVNPNQTCLDELLDAARVKQSEVASALVSNPGSSELNNLKTELDNLVGVDADNYAGSAHSQAQDMSDFLSGQIDSFPTQGLSNRLSGKSHTALLEGQNLFSVLNALQSRIQIRSHLCSIDPDKPCDAVEDVMNMVKTQFCSDASAMTNLIQVSSNGDLLDELKEFIGALINKLDRAINTMLDAVIDGLQYGMSKLLEELMGDDCFSEALGNVVDLPLKEALNWPGI